MELKLVQSEADLVDTLDNVQGGDDLVVDAPKPKKAVAKKVASKKAVAKKAPAKKAVAKKIPAKKANPIGNAKAKAKRALVNVGRKCSNGKCKGDAYCKGLCANCYSHAVRYPEAGPRVIK